MTADTANGNGNAATNGVANSQQQQLEINGKTTAIVESATPQLEQLYSRIYSHPMVQQVLYRYDRTKHCCGIVEKTLGTVETGVTGVAQRAAPIYNSYCAPPAENLLWAYSKGIETTKSAVQKSRDVAVATTTLGLGAAVVATQLSLALGIAGTNLMLDSVIATKRIGGRVVTGVYDTEKAIEARIYTALENTQKIVQWPLEKTADYSNFFLDIANSVADRWFGGESTAEQADSTLKERVRYLGRRLSNGLTTKAHDEVIDPVQRQVKVVTDQLSKSLILVEFVRARKEWAFEKAEKLSSSVLDLKQMVEKEASQYKVEPEAFLLRSIRQSSNQLTTNLESLKEKRGQVLGDGANAKLDAATTYLQKLEANLADADTIYKVRDEVIAEAKQKLSELTAWTSSWLVRERNGVTVE